MAFAEHEFALSERQPDGSTLRATLHSGWRQRLERNPRFPPPDGLFGPPCPEAARYLWDWYLDLARGRPAGEHPARLSSQEIKAWCDLNGVRLRPWEVTALRRLDDAEFSAIVQQLNKARALAAGR